MGQRCYGTALLWDSAAMGQRCYGTALLWDSAAMGQRCCCRCSCGCAVNAACLCSPRSPRRGGQTCLRLPRAWGGILAAYVGRPRIAVHLGGTQATPWRRRIAAHRRHLGNVQPMEALSAPWRRPVACRQGRRWSTRACCAHPLPRVATRVVCAAISAPHAVQGAQRSAWSTWVACSLQVVCWTWLVCSLQGAWAQRSDGPADHPRAPGAAGQHGALCMDRVWPYSVQQLDSAAGQRSWTAQLDSCRTRLRDRSGQRQPVQQATPCRLDRPASGAGLARDGRPSGVSGQEDESGVGYRARLQASRVQSEASGQQGTERGFRLVGDMPTSRLACLPAHRVCTPMADAVCGETV
jgi:hypothetical protein